MTLPLLFPAFAGGTDINILSGTQYFMLQAARQVGLPLQAVTVPMPQEQTLARLLWRAKRLAMLRRPSGFTMSPGCLANVWDAPGRFPAGSQVLSYFALVSPAMIARAERGEIALSYYIDTTYQEYVSTYGEHAKADPALAARAYALEGRGFRAAQHVFTFSRASAEFIGRTYGARAEAVMPGSNIDLALLQQATRQPRRRGADPFIITFVGMDWQRKGLPCIAAAVQLLREAGEAVILRVIGEAPPEIRKQPGVEFIGRIDKMREMDRYARLARDSDLGILMSEADAMAMSMIESLSVGVPVLAPRLGGLPDYITPDLGILVPPGTGPEALAARLRPLLSRGAEWQALCRGAEAGCEALRWTGTMRRIGEAMGYPMAPRLAPRPEPVAA